MTRPIEVMRLPFVRRLHAPLWWSGLAYVLPRPYVTIGLALLPALLFLLAALAMPRFAEVATQPGHVRDTFARFISGLITAATIAVSFSTLALRRGLKGIGELRDHVEADLDFRARVRRDGGHESLPVTIGPFLAVILQGVAERARDIRETAGSAALAYERDGVTLQDYLDTLETRALLIARRCEVDGNEPDALLAAALDFEQEYASHLARRFSRTDRLPESVQDRMETLVAALRDCDVARGYVKTLDTQWGLSRMSHVIVTTSFIATFVSAGLVLGYGPEALAALGARNAAILVALGLLSVAAPLAAFVSYSLRFVFVNQHSLPIGAFALGPEKRHLGQRRSVSRRSRLA